MLTMVPGRCRRMCGSTSWISRAAPKTLTSGSGRGRAGRDPGAEPAERDALVEDLEWPPLSGLSPSAIGRIWRQFELKPHVQDFFMLSTDPQFVDKVVDVVGLYHHPPERAVVVCVDEKSGMQALDRSQPGLEVGSAEYGNLVAHDEQLDVPGRRRAAEQCQPAQ
jgi:hypothetical protein